MRNPALPLRRALSRRAFGVRARRAFDPGRQRRWSCDGGGAWSGPRRRIHGRALAVAVAAALLLPGAARAHLGSTKYLRVDPTAGGLRIVADLDPIDLAYELGLPDPDAPDVGALLARDAELRAWASRAFTVRSEKGVCALAVGTPSRIDLEGAVRAGEAIRIPIEVTCPEPRTGIVLRDDSIFGSDPQHEAIVRIGERATVLRAGRQEVVIAAQRSTGATVMTFLLEGALHLVTGYDHVLFLVSLLLVAGERAAREGAKKAAADVAWVVTGFTVGHSATLIAAALDVVSLPARLVESAIAASIVIVAAWNVVGPEARAALPGVAVGFGLIHGFGFSSVLRELVLPASERVTALLAFNLGIELAQLAIVALLIGPLAWAGRRRWYRPAVVQGGSAIVGAIGLGWLIERAFG
jgi:hypothetical protein